MKRKISVNTQTGGARPEAFVTKGKQRLKQYIDTVYLNNGDEFEVELYNPTTNKVLAKVEMNGNSIGAGVVLRPGERVFLERFLNETKKFLFETYNVEGDNNTVEKAIAKNGDVVIKFYDEYVQPQYVQPQYYYTNTGGYNSSFTIGNSTYGPSVTYTTNNVAGSFTTTDSIISNCVNTLLSNTSTSNILTDPGIGYDTKISEPVKKQKRSVETGRVEKGSESNQTFTYDNSTFNYYPCASNWWKILPVSQQVVVKEDLKVFCTECGSKRKKDSHKFCPHCGTKF